MNKNYQLPPYIAIHQQIVEIFLVNIYHENKIQELARDSIVQ